jgi:hypothetical protein
LELLLVWDSDGQWLSAAAATRTRRRRRGYTVGGMTAKIQTIVVPAHLSMDWM